MKKKPSNHLIALLDYDPFTGKISSSKCKCSSVQDKNGYVSVSWLGVTYPAHRLAFLIAEMPLDDLVVHHKNRKPWDNRFRNLIAMTRENHKYIHIQLKAAEKHLYSLRNATDAGRDVSKPIALAETRRRIFFARLREEFARIRYADLLNGTHTQLGWGPL